MFDNCNIWRISSDKIIKSEGTVWCGNEDGAQRWSGTGAMTVNIDILSFVFYVNMLNIVP